MACFTTATERQISFLTSLITERGLSLDKAVMLAFGTDQTETFEIGRRECSQMIDAVKAVRRPERERPAAPDLEAGMYKVGQDICRVKIYKSSGRPYAEILCHDAIVNGNYADAAVSVEIERGMIMKYGITPDHLNNLHQCAEIRLLFGTRCGSARELAQPKSIAKGIGPVCEKKVWLPPSDESPRPASRRGLFAFRRYGHGSTRRAWYRYRYRGSGFGTTGTGPVRPRRHGTAVRAYRARRGTARGGVLVLGRPDRHERSRRYAYGRVRRHHVRAGPRTRRPVPGRGGRSNRLPDRRRDDRDRRAHGNQPSKPIFRAVEMN